MLQVGIHSPTGLVPQLWSNNASYLTGPLVNTGGVIIVAVLRTLPFPKCASSNYKATQTPHTHRLHSNWGIFSADFSLRICIHDTKYNRFILIKDEPSMEILNGLHHNVIDIFNWLDIKCQNAFLNMSGHIQHCTYKIFTNR